MNEIEIRGFLETEISEKEMTEKERKTLDDLAGQLNDAVRKKDDYIFMVLNQLEEIQHILEVNLKENDTKILHTHFCGSKFRFSNKIYMYNIFLSI